MSENKNSKWISILAGMVMAALAAFGIGQFIRGNQEEARRIDAQNEIARTSEIVQENDNLWSRLAEQQEDLLEKLRESSAELADSIEERDEQILSMSEAIARFGDIRVVVRSQNVTQSEPEEGRVRVDFHEEVDPISVEGFTLTNPAESELTVGFVRPLRLTTTVVQGDDGSWKAYIEGDWPNLEIEQLSTYVDPQPITGRSFAENIFIGIDVSTSFQFDAAFVNLYAMYEFNDVIAVGPSIGVGLIQDQARVLFGLRFHWAPWRQ